ncbi:MAG: malonyl-CoA synthase [Betaproteobacteria bacterium]|nr:MAG: malonyl-CoA synthase [Betaproteobacteria bacterium]
MKNDNIFAAIRAAFPASADAVAIESGDNGTTYSWRDIDRITAQVANLLTSLNLPAGSRVAVQTEKSVEALLLYLAVLRAGYVYLPLNNAYQAGEIAYFIENAEPAVFVCTSKTRSWIEPIAIRCKVAHCFTLDDGSGTLLDAARSHSTEHVVAQKSAQDLAAILYTSGTTGRSKGAMLSHSNLLSNARTLLDYWGWSASDVLIHALPIFHVHGLFVASHCALLAGAKMIWFAKFEPQAVVNRLPDATVFMGVPTLYVRLLAEASLTRAQCRNMRLFVAGSAPLLIETFNAFRERTGHTILERYGMSETVMLTSNPYRAEDGERRGGTVGFALPGVGVRVRNDAAAECAIDEIGGIEVTGPNVFSGYWQMPEKTKEEFTSDGWFKTGDVGKRDARGYFTIVGRSKDLIISGGYNVYPAEIEGYINDLPGVAESAVIGVPHPDFGEAVVAVVVAKTGKAIDADAMIASIKANIANFKVPKRLFVVSELPRNAMGKVQKNVLREEHKSLFAESSKRVAQR